MDENSMLHYRLPEYPIHPLLFTRWSARAMSGEGLTDDELMPLFEAAKWAPSSYNSQPWRFIYARRESKSWNTFFDLLVPFNQQWAQHAAALVVILSYRYLEHNGKPSNTHSFDTGAAWQNLCLEGHARKLVVHGMEGFDRERTYAALHIPKEYSIEAMAAVGKPGKVAQLPLEKMQHAEKPKGRNPLSSFVMCGSFQGEVLKEI